MKRLLLSALLCCTPFAEAAADPTGDASQLSDYLLLPAPQKISYSNTVQELRDDRIILLNHAIDDASVRAGLLLKQAMKTAGVRWEIAAARGHGDAAPGLTVEIDPARVRQPQGYRLEIGPEATAIVAHDPAGAFYAAQTLNQIAQQAGAGQRLRCLTIEDWPDFPARGVMLDISRDKVPAMHTLFALIDRLASWKINQFQLYTEHTFAYRDHRDVWARASPMTAEQILVLDRYCRERFIELVPNQNSFGHLERWFKHERYWPLAEQLDIKTPTGDFKGWALCPTDPASVEFLAGLYDELLPNFSSPLFNVGCDEVYGLGEGRSKPIADERGKERVYLDFLLQIQREAALRGKTIQFWSDAVVKHPELIPELPRDDVIALVWGYLPTTPFDERGAMMAASGVKFYVCPGTGVWQSIVGRLEKATGNIRNAAVNGRKHGAIGFLNTNWGDFGNWETLPFSWPGFVYGAAVGWAVEPNLDANLPALLDTHVFGDKAGLAGQVLCDLGFLQIPGAENMRRSLLQDALRAPDANWNRHGQLKPLTPENLRATQQQLQEILARFERATMHSADEAIVRAEITHAIALLLFSAELGIEKLSAPGKTLENIPAKKRQALAAQMETLIQEFRRIWLLRSRPGGLDDSVKPLERIVHLLRQTAEGPPPVIGDPAQ